MKRLGIALIAMGLASFAHAADLPTTKAPEKAKPNCWASFWDWLNSSAADCPISAYGITLYGTLDLNATYLHEGVDKHPAADKVNYSIQRNAIGSRWLAGYNGLSASVIGLKMKEDPGPHRSAGLVADRRSRSGRQSVFGHVRQRTSLARR
jgi:hypothetical protein